MKTDMSDEKAPNKKMLLPKGWRKFTISSCEPSKSKSGNDMFVIGIVDSETKYEDKLYAVATQGKRWFLKTILSACNISAGQDGVYEWETTDLIGKDIAGLVEHEPNEFINREGVTIKTTQHRINEVKKSDETIGWDDDK